MINKIYKTIHNKYLKFFRFIFSIRYLFAIFIISIALFLIIPMYLNYEKRMDIIKTHLVKNYNFEINKFEKIKFKVFPLPNLELQNVQILFNSSQIKFKAKNLKIYPKLFSIYNLKNFKTNKIVLKDNNISLKPSDLKPLINFTFNQKEKLLFKNLDLEIINKKTLILKLENIKFSNYGYNKNLITGKIFDKEFKIKIKKDFKNLNFRLLNSGISADINFEESKKDNSITGSFKSKILNNNLKFNYEYDNKVLNVFDTFFRGKDFSFNNKSSVIFSPYFNINTVFDIQQINFKVIDKINFIKILEAKNFIKKINGKNEFNFISNKFSRNLIDELNLKLDITYGMVDYDKKFLISDHRFECKGNINLLEEKPLLFFDCFIFSNNKQKLLKEFSIQSKSKNEILKLNVSGNLNILNKKINLKKINMNDNYKASKEDLIYFKGAFENILFNENFIEIFSLKKIKKFILEIT